MSRRGRRAMAQINVVPYIDVMLVLLVIFMVAAPMLQPGVVDLPSVARADRALDLKPLRVQIGKDGALRLDDGKSAPQPLADASRLLEAIKASQSGPEQPVVIEGDRNARYEEVMKVMSALKEGGIARVGLVVQPRT